MISVCMATFNGEKYIRDQIESVLNNLCDEDEIIISDDGSSDKTISIISEYQSKYGNIKLVNGPKQGVIANFENALLQAKGEYIYTCDQDDIWEDNKVAIVQRQFENQHVMVVVHDAYVVDGNLQIIFPSFYEFRNSSSGILKNIIKNSYIGCCMAFRRQVIDSALPIPRNIEMHDQWIGICGELIGKSIFIQDKLLKYRRYGNNVSSFKHHGVIKMLKNRLYFICNLICMIIRR